VALQEELYLCSHMVMGHACLGVVNAKQITGMSVSSVFWQMQGNVLLLLQAVKVGCQVRACKQLRHSTGQRLAFAQTQATAARGYMITDNELSAVTTGYASRDREAELTSSKLVSCT